METGYSIQPGSFWEKRFWGIKAKELIIVLFLYAFFSFLYHLVLWINERGFKHGFFSLFNFRDYMDMSGLGYIIMLLLTIPIWWLIFRKLSHWKLRNRLLVHLLTLPIFAFSYLKLLYSISEYVNFFYLSGELMVWDVYIPVLHYIIQFGIFHAYEYYKKSLENLQLKAELNKAAIQSELVTLKAQLNPHFLYNTFNTISASVPLELENTREMIAKLAKLFRYILKGTKDEFVLLQEEIEFARTYLQLEQERFGHRLNYEFKVDTLAYERLIPPMILQPLLENAVKHGISPLVEGGKIEVNIIAKESETIFELCDNGAGMQDNIIGGGIGLTNTKLRLYKIYQAPLHIESEPGEGVRIKFKIPLHAKSHNN